MISRVVIVAIGVVTSRYFNSFGTKLVGCINGYYNKLTVNKTFHYKF